MDVDQYLRAFEHQLVNLRFSAMGSKFVGNGVVAWNPDQGMHLKGRFEAEESAEKPIELPRVVTGEKWIKIVGETDFGDTFQMEVPTVGELGLIFGRLDVVGASARFERPTSMRHQGDCWHPSALIDFGDASALPLLPDAVERTMKIGNWSQRMRVPATAATGIHEERPDGSTVIGYSAADPQFLRLAAVLPRAAWTSEEAWSWAKSAGEAFVWLSGRNARAVYVEDNVDGVVRRLYRRRERAESLFPYLPLPGHPQIDKKRLLRLLDFLARETTERRIAREMHCQLVDAANQRGVVGRDLLMSSILEALLRCVYNKPFVGQKAADEFNLEHSLKTFASERLGAGFRGTRKEALAAFRRLRDRAAHPDWGLLNWRSPEDAQRALDDRIFLARFYCCLVLSFAGVDDLVPLDDQAAGVDATADPASIPNDAST